MLPQDDPPAPGILSFTSGETNPEGLVFRDPQKPVSVVPEGVSLLLLKTVSSSQDPVFVNKGSAADMDEVFASSGTNL